MTAKSGTAPLMPAAYRRIRAFQPFSDINADGGFAAVSAMSLRTTQPAMRKPVLEVGMPSACSGRRWRRWPILPIAVDVRQTLRVTYTQNIIIPMRRDRLRRVCRRHLISMIASILSTCREDFLAVSGAPCRNRMAAAQYFWLHQCLRARSEHYQITLGGRADDAAAASDRPSPKTRDRDNRSSLTTWPPEPFQPAGADRLRGRGPCLISTVPSWRCYPMRGSCDPRMSGATS